VSYSSFNATLIPKSATDSRDPKVGNLRTKTQHPWHH
jgi:hypothetical protein